MFEFIKNNIQLVSIVLFLVFFGVLISVKPSLVFDKTGKPRQFGIGYKNKTICPIWLIVIIFGIFSYFFVLYYINFNRIVF